MQRTLWPVTDAASPGWFLTRLCLALRVTFPHCVCVCVRTQADPKVPLSLSTWFVCVILCSTVDFAPTSYSSTHKAMVKERLSLQEPVLASLCSSARPWEVYGDLCVPQHLCSLSPALPPGDCLFIAVPLWAKIDQLKLKNQDKVYQALPLPSWPCSGSLEQGHLDATGRWRGQLKPQPHRGDTIKQSLSHALHGGAVLAKDILK